MRIALIVVLLVQQAFVFATSTLVLSCSADNDLYKILRGSGVDVVRVDTPEEAIRSAPTSAGVMLLADEYPNKALAVDPRLLESARLRSLRLFIEFPGAESQLTSGTVKQLGWERAVVSDSSLNLNPLRILGIHSAHVLETEGVSTGSIVAARVAGFDMALFGLPSKTYPVLFHVPDKNLIVATTNLSNFVKSRYLPSADWETVWKEILAQLCPRQTFDLRWKPNVLPMYAEKEPLPKDAERKSQDAFASWILSSGLLIPDSSVEKVLPKVKSNSEISTDPLPLNPGNGKNGILEGFASAIEPDGSQPWRPVLRADCNAESAMALALSSRLRGNDSRGAVAQNLLDYVFSEAGMSGGPYGDPKHPAYGLIAWGALSPVWFKATYGDDEARTILSAIISGVCLKTEKWNERVMLAINANLETTGKSGFRGDRIDLPELEKNGRAFYANAEPVNCSPHFEGGLWSCYLWAYGKTKDRKYLERAKAGIATTMKAYPKGWRWNDNIERSRMLLPLAWLVRAEDKPEHRQWLAKVVDDLIALQEPCGAIREDYNASGGGGHFKTPQSNEAYGTSETPLIQENGDPVSDQLYTTGFALFGLHEAALATKEQRYMEAENRLAEYLCRIQIKSDKHKWLHGGWFRAFDFRKWDFWASSADMGWGPWCVEAGWAPAWTHCTYALREMKTSYWDFTLAE